MKRKRPEGAVAIGGVRWERYRAEDFATISGARRRQLRTVRNAKPVLLH